MQDSITYYTLMSKSEMPEGFLSEGQSGKANKQRAKRSNVLHVEKQV